MNNGLIVVVDNKNGEKNSGVFGSNANERGSVTLGGERVAVNAKEGKKRIFKGTKYYDDVLVQRFIDRPFLMDGHVADLRSFAVVLCAQPYVVLFNKG